MEAVESNSALPLLKRTETPRDASSQKTLSAAVDTPAKSKKKKWIIAGIISAAIAGAIDFGIHSYYYVSTDNAMVQAPTTLLAAKVGGVIIRSNIKENQHVNAGDVLLEIRPDEYRYALAKAAGNLAEVKAQLMNAETDFNRVTRLRQGGAATTEEVDNVNAKLEAVRAHAEAAKAEVREGLLNLDYTEIKAPANGRIGRKSFEVGLLATPGTPLMGFVADDERWVVANFKETDMDHIAIGKTAVIEVDAIGSVKFDGTVESISPNTGATFSLLPPDNATGNFTKVVQRVPVRIKLLHLSQAETDRLQAGLSAEVTVKIR